MNKYLIVSGSTRRVSQSSKVARYIQAQLQSLESAAEVHLIDLSRVPLPAWHEDLGKAEAEGKAESESESESEASEQWSTVSPLFNDSTALIFVSPEWNGMVPPALMNVFLLADQGQLAHKPALIVTVSASRGGAYPVVQLRSFGHKNTQICYIPDHVIVRNAREMLNGSEPQTDADRYLRDRLAYSLRVLGAYSKALNQVRDSGVIDRRTYSNGM